MQCSTAIWLVIGAAALVSAPAVAQSAPPIASDDTIIVTSTPIEGSETSARSIPAPVQTATAKDIADSHALDLSAFLNRQIGSVYVNDVQNNPLQPDVNYRGYTASPLLGTPQGLSLYMDGVRLNQPFGDVVSWDLIPREAISSMALMPGSNPLFGLNTLGGALSIRTKSGVTDPGTSLEAGYGDNNRYQLTAATGGQAGDFNWYATANKFSDDGWRDASPSDASQFFGKLGWTRGKLDLAFSAALADTNLTGNGLQEQRFLARDYGSIYTKPDNTKNKSGLANLTARYDVSDTIKLSGDIYYRQITTRTLNGDINDDSLTESIYQPGAAEQTALTDAGYTGFPTSGETAANTLFPKWRCIANILLNDEPNEKCNGLLNRSRTGQTEWGATGQATFAGALGGRANQFTIGAAYNESHAHFAQSTRFGYLTPDRGVQTVDGPGAFADGTQDSEDADDARVDLTGRTHVWSAYATDTFAILPTLNLVVSGRYDETRVKNHDRITPIAGPGSLTGTHTFSRFNPAVGLTYSPTDDLTAYVGYTEGSRAPSAIELGCSDPDNPCRLPNALAGDPPLQQVVTRTEEIGASGRIMDRFTWRAGLFRAVNDDDIMFIANDVSGFGYFQNVGKTQRQGVELGAGADFGPVRLNAAYTYLDATYRTEQAIPGEGNSTNETGPGFEGDITVEKGDRIPLVPQNIFKLNADWDVTRTITLNANVQAQDGVYARGNENNQHRPDGQFYLGPGKTDGFAILNLGGEWRPTEHLKLFLEVNNVFDKKYSTSAQLGATGFTADGSFIARPFAGPVVDGERPTLGATFFGPGAPRLFWGGVRYSF
jgi:outer membrane receptor protein involved in Fe transport